MSTPDFNKLTQKNNRARLEKLQSVSAIDSEETTMNMKDLKANGERIRHLMLMRGIAEQKELAKMAGVTEGTLSRFLNGGNFSTTTLVAVANALDVNPIDLLDTSEFPDSLLEASKSAVEVAGNNA